MVGTKIDIGQQERISVGVNIEFYDQTLKV